MVKKSSNEDLFLQAIKNIAKNNLEDNTHLLKRWWSNKYNLPTNHPLLLEKYEEELMIEYYEDEQFQDELEKEMNKPTDDENWENELTEEHDQKIQNKLKKYNLSPVIEKWQKKAKEIEELTDEIDEFEEINEEF